MAVKELLTRKDLAAYHYTITLEGVQYRFDYQYNERMGKWFVSISDTAANIIIAPVPVVAGLGIFDRFVMDGIPPGITTPFDTSGDNLDPGRFELGDRVRMLYLEST